MVVDPIELELDNAYKEMAPQEEHGDNVYVDMIEPTAEWNNKRNELAEAMWLNVSTNLYVCISHFAMFFPIHKKVFKKKVQTYVISLLNKHVRFSK